MDFLKQIKMDIMNILRSRFILIICILILSASIIFPVIDYFTPGDNNGGGGIVRPLPIPIDIGFSSKVVLDMIGYPRGIDINQGDPIIVDGTKIEPDNPFYWQVNGIMQEKEAMEADKNRFSGPDVLDLALSIMDEELKLYVHFAKFITDDPMDYRIELAWQGVQYVHEKFLHEHHDVEEEKLLEAVNTRMGIDPETFKKKYIDISPEERLAALDDLDDKLNTIYSVVENNDFPKYIDLRIQQENKVIEDLEQQIEIYEQTIIDDPSQEEVLSSIIEDLKRQIELIKNNNIPILEYRLEKNIIPGKDTWQNRALNDIQNSRSQLIQMKILSEEEFMKQPWLVEQYRSYQKYVSTLQAEIDNLNKTIFIAERSLESDKPDMKYIPGGARNKTVRFLEYSTFVALFAVLLGGWIIASEFQQGTIRLLLIRPKTRVKILMSKFLAAFLICLVIYLAGSILNLITNGICFGFSDYMYPNYTMSGAVNFFAYYLPKMIACITTIIFAFTVSFMLSVVVKNAAIAIAVPIACFVGSNILVNTFTYSRIIDWFVYTPIPYIQISSFFVPYSSIQQIIQRGISLSLTFGIIMLLVLSALCTAVSILVFKTRDITN